MSLKSKEAIERKKNAKYPIPSGYKEKREVLTKLFTSLKDITVKSHRIKKISELTGLSVRQLEIHYKRLNWRDIIQRQKKERELDEEHEKAKKRILTINKDLAYGNLNKLAKENLMMGIQASNTLIEYSLRMILFYIGQNEAIFLKAGGLDQLGVDDKARVTYNEKLIQYHTTRVEKHTSASAVKNYLEVLGISDYIKNLDDAEGGKQFTPEFMLNMISEMGALKADDDIRVNDRLYRAAVEDAEIIEIPDIRGRKQED